MLKREDDNLKEEPSKDIFISYTIVTAVLKKNRMAIRPQSAIPAGQSRLTGYSPAAPWIWVILARVVVTMAVG